MHTDDADVFDFDDSEVAFVRFEGSTLLLRFAVARVWHGGEAGYRKAVELRLLNARCDDALDDCLGTIAEGRLAVDGQVLQRLPLPFDTSGAVRLNLRWRNRATLSASASGARLLAADNGPVLADHAC